MGRWAARLGTVGGTLSQSIQVGRLIDIGGRFRDRDKPSIDRTGKAIKRMTLRLDHPIGKRRAKGGWPKAHQRRCLEHRRAGVKGCNMGGHQAQRVTARCQYGIKAIVGSIDHPAEQTAQRAKARLWRILNTDQIWPVAPGHRQRINMRVQGIGHMVDQRAALMEGHRFVAAKSGGLPPGKDQAQ